MVGNYYRICYRILPLFLTTLLSILRSLSNSLMVCIVETFHIIDPELHGFAAIDKTFQLAFSKAGLKLKVFWFRNQERWSSKLYLSSSLSLIWYLGPSGPRACWVVTMVSDHALFASPESWSLVPCTSAPQRMNGTKTSWRRSTAASSMRLRARGDSKSRSVLLFRTTSHGMPPSKPCPACALPRRPAAPQPPPLPGTY